ETRAPLARSIIGGIVLSTLVTLIIVPLFYMLFDRLGGWVLRAAQRDEPAHPPVPPSADGVAAPHGELTEPSGKGDGAEPAPRAQELEPVLEVRPETVT